MFGVEENGIGKIRLDMGCLMRIQGAKVGVNAITHSGMTDLKSRSCDRNPAKGGFCRVNSFLPDGTNKPLACTVGTKTVKNSQKGGVWKSAGRGSLS
jgi:hypothetical protein